MPTLHPQEFKEGIASLAGGRLRKAQPHGVPGSLVFEDQACSAQGWWGLLLTKGSTPCSEDGV